jgi:hypothetical protein
MDLENTNKKLYNRENYKNYEYFCVDYHTKNFNQQTWHWNSVPESVLYESGFIYDFNELRLNRKEFYQNNNQYYNHLREYGLDIGKRNSQYGYKMPLPEKGIKQREIIIFRRY